MPTLAKTDLALQISSLLEAVSRIMNIESDDQDLLFTLNKEMGKVLETTEVLIKIEQNLL